MSDAELSGRADNLARGVADLSDSINELMARTQQSADQLRRSRRTVRLTIAGLVLDVILTLVIVFVINRERELSDAQETVNREVLCPLYGVLLRSYNQARRDAMPPAEQVKYDQAFDVVRQGARTLGCPQ